MLLSSDCIVLGSGAFLADNCFNDKCGESRTKISEVSLKGKPQLRLGVGEGSLTSGGHSGDKNKLGTFALAGDPWTQAHLWKWKPRHTSSCQSGHWGTYFFSVATERFPSAWCVCSG